MKLKLLSLGDNLPAWINTGVQEYVKRLSPLSFELIEIPLLKRTKITEQEKILKAEAKLTLQSIKSTDHLVVLDRTGDSWSTEQLAEHMQHWQLQGKDIVLLIGGPEGISQEVLQRAQQKWSLSKLTFPHPIARLITVEQLYRAHTILINHPYHR